MLVTGVTQLLTAPLAVALEQHVEARLLTSLGFGVFGLGLGLSGLQTLGSDLWNCRPRLFRSKNCPKHFFPKKLVIFVPKRQSRPVIQLLRTLSEL